MKILVTGCAGFIGSHLCEELLSNNNIVYGIDTLNDYYDVNKKNNNVCRIKNHKNNQNFFFSVDDLITTTIITKEFNKNNGFDVVINIGAMAGVRYSQLNPEIYVDTNIKGQIHLLEESLKNKVKLFVYASSSSVYGLNEDLTFSETDQLNKVNSVYAMTKKCAEDFANLYNRLYNLNVVGLRFFTVYGPHGRPDMFPYKLLEAIDSEKEFTKFGDGTSCRDYTYIDDIVEGIMLSITHNINKQSVCEIYNLGNSKPVTLNEFIDVCSKITKKTPKFIQAESQLGDVPYTCANISKTQKDLNYFPKTTLEEGLTKMYEWFNSEK